MKFKNRVDEEKQFVHLTDCGPRCLEQIILAQLDEAKQRYCIYQFQDQDEKNSTKGVEKMYQIRVKSIEFQDEHAIAIYFYNMTREIESIRLGQEQL